MTPWLPVTDEDTEPAVSLKSLWFSGSAKDSITNFTDKVRKRLSGDRVFQGESKGIRVFSNQKHWGGSLEQGKPSTHFKG